MKKELAIAEELIIFKELFNTDGEHLTVLNGMMSDTLTACSENEYTP